MRNFERCLSALLVMSFCFILGREAVGFSSTKPTIPATRGSSLLKVYSMGEFRTHLMSVLAGGVASADILVSFDWDGTLNGGRVVEGKRVLGVRDGEQTFELINYLNSNGIPYFINTAAGPTRVAVVRTAMLVAGMQERSGGPFVKRELKCSTELSQGCNGDLGKAVTHRVGTSVIGQCDCVFSAEYEKTKVIEFVIEKFHPRPRVVIHVDDSALMVKEGFEVFSSAPFEFQGVFYPPLGVSAHPEPGQEEAERFIDSHLGRGREPTSATTQSKKR